MQRVRTAPKREHLIHVNVSAEERALLREQAMVERRTVSDVIREAIYKYHSEAK